MNTKTDHMNVVINFHKGDQYSAKLLLELLLLVDEGIECSYYLQYGDEIATLKTYETCLKFLNHKKAYFSNKLPQIKVPEEMMLNDPNQLRYEGNHTNRSRMQKLKHLQWNLCVYKYIQELESFLMVEPDSVILKHGWLNDIHSGWKDYEGPIFGHLKKGKIKNEYIPTHWAGSSLYNCTMLKELDLEKYFYERYPNPWWPYRNEKDTVLADNCFWGPMFSGYDITYDYFLFGLYWKEKTGSNDPYQWPLQKIPNRQDLIFCDFNTKMTTQEIFNQFAEKLPLMHGIKSNEIREKMIKQFASSDVIKNTYGYDLSGPASSPAAKRNDTFFNIGDLKDKFLNERCFIIGNGPSLNKTNMKLLKSEYTIGLNRIYLNYANMEFEPTFYCVVNPNVIEQFAHEIDKINSIKFIRKESKGLIKNRWNVFFVDSLLGHDFNQNFESLGWYEGWTVTYCAMQVAFYLGFKTVILIGVDHYFKEAGEPNKLVTANAIDSNHFHPDYFGKGTKWQYPDLEHSEKSYNIAKKVYMENGRMILDATIGGKLKLFPKVDYLSLFGKTPC